ncbi:hypothetical protein JW905_16560, partial [bacterium]|nr:hypothetical protein [candidate division CSSED10-310 bacterium]
YVYTDQEAMAAGDFGETPDIIEFFAESFGEYPFIQEKYGQVGVPIGGGMEHQTITHIRDSYITGAGMLSLVAHELAHQWWGDYITMASWPDIWLNEGFATYSDALYQEHRFGAEHLRNLMKGYAGTTYHGSIYDPVQLFDGIVYYKGAWVLHMLRWLVGEDNFWAIMRAYYDNQDLAFGNASTDDFRMVCETVFGQDLTQFFQQWIYGESRPTYEYGWSVDAGSGGGTVELTIRQTQTDTGLFTMPLELGFLDAEGWQYHRIWNSLAEQTYQFETDNPVYFIEFDPNERVLDWSGLAPDQFQITNDWKLNQARFGEWYEEAFEVINGTPPLRFELLEGELPPGIELDMATGRFSGFPWEQCKRNFTIRVSDSSILTRYFQREYQIKTVGGEPADLTLFLNQQTFAGGDEMLLSMTLTNNTEEECLESLVYIVIEAGGAYFYLDPFQTCYPAFNETPVPIPLTLPAGFSLSADVLALTLPAELPPLSGAWYGAVLNAGNSALFAPLSEVEFTF